MAMPRFCSECGAPLPAPPPVMCRACDTSHWLDAKPCAGALVSRAGKLLLVRRAHEPWKGAWDVPGGFCGPREHPRGGGRARGARGDGPRGRGGWRPRDVDRQLRARRPGGRQGHAQHLLPRRWRPGASETRSDPNEVAEIAWFAADELPEPLAFPGHLPAVLRAWRAARTEAARGRRQARRCVAPPRTPPLARE